MIQRNLSLSLRETINHTLDLERAEGMQRHRQQVNIKLRLQSYLVTGGYYTGKTGLATNKLNNTGE